MLQSMGSQRVGHDSATEQLRVTYSTVFVRLEVLAWPWATFDLQAYINSTWKALAVRSGLLLRQPGENKCICRSHGSLSFLPAS